MSLWKDEGEEEDTDTREEDEEGKASPGEEMNLSECDNLWHLHFLLWWKLNYETHATLAHTASARAYQPHTHTAQST